jgi:hypothetical protein
MQNPCVASRSTRPDATTRGAPIRLVSDLYWYAFLSGQLFGQVDILQHSRILAVDPYELRGVAQ